MSNQKIDMIGRRFGLLVVEREATAEETAHIKNNGYYYFCRCDCGNTTISRGVNLRNGSKKSCGCMQGKKYSETESETVKKEKQQPAAKKREYSTQTAFQKRMKKCGEVKAKLCEKYGKCYTSPLGKCPLAMHGCYAYATITDLYNGIGVGGRKPLIDTIKQAAKEFDIEV